MNNFLVPHDLFDLFSHGNHVKDANNHRKKIEWEPRFQGAFEGDSAALGNIELTLVSRSPNPQM